jgi:peptidoglycan/xylan/chitin deacetylase (PgdA/CDA1 family)
MSAAYEESRDPNSGSLPQRVAGMASRFLARQSRSKVLRVRASAPIVSFTFDDVPASACELGAPILEKYGARGTFFVSGGGDSAAFDGGPPRASIEQLRTIWASGHEIGCHTFSHPTVRHMSIDEIGAELDRNQSALRKIDKDLVVRNFAYPYGDLSIRTKRYLQSRFDSCRAGHPGINSGLADLGGLDAWPLQNALLDHAKIEQLIAETVRSRGWLIFYTHQVAEQPNRYGVSPDLLERAVITAKEAGCVVTTIAGSLELLNDLANNG